MIKTDRQISISQIKEQSRYIRNKAVEISNNIFFDEEFINIKELIEKDEEVALEFESLRKVIYPRVENRYRGNSRSDKNVNIARYIEEPTKYEFSIFSQYMVFRKLCIITEIFEINLETLNKKVELQLLGKEDLDIVQKEIQEVRELFEYDQKYFDKMEKNKILQMLQYYCKHTECKTLIDFTNSINNVRQKLKEIAEFNPS